MCAGPKDMPAAHLRVCDILVEHDTVQHIALLQLATRDLSSTSRGGGGLGDGNLQARAGTTTMPDSTADLLHFRVALDVNLLAAVQLVGHRLNSLERNLAGHVGPERGRGQDKRGPGVRQIG